MKSAGCFVIILLISFVSSSFAAVGYAHYNDPKNPGKCTITDSLILSPGETAKDPNHCVRITCGDDGLANIAGCGVTNYGDKCKAGDYIDESLPYPGCCKRRVVCE